MRDKLERAKSSGVGFRDWRKTRRGRVRGAEGSVGILCRSRGAAITAAPRCRMRNSTHIGSGFRGRRDRSGVSWFLVAADSRTASIFRGIARLARQWQKRHGELFEPSGLRGFGRTASRAGRLHAPALQNQASEPGIHFGIDQFLQQLAEFFAQVRRLVQARKLDGFERTCGTACQVFEWRTGIAHEIASMASDPQKAGGKEMHAKVAGKESNAIVPR